MSEALRARRYPFVANGEEPLEALRATRADVRVRACPEARHYVLRARSAPELTAALEAGEGVSLPLEPNTSQGFDHGDVLWLSPTEWLMVRRDERAPLLDERWWLDQTSGYAALEVSGAEAPELIAAGCSVDVHPRSFPPRRCAQTLFAKTSIVLFCVDGAPTYRLTVRRSHAAHLWRWIALNLELL